MAIATRQIQKPHPLGSSALARASGPTRNLRTPHGSSNRLFQTRLEKASLLMDRSRRLVPSQAGSIPVSAPGSSVKAVSAEFNGSSALLVALTAHDAQCRPSAHACSPAGLQEEFCERLQISPHHSTTARAS